MDVTPVNDPDFRGLGDIYTKLEQMNYEDQDGELYTLVQNY
jgi:hypothetical protein